MRRPNVFVMAIGLAIGGFWATMLTDPPRTEASLGRPPACAVAAKHLAPWFEIEGQRSGLVNRDARRLNELAVWFGDAQSQCASGIGDRSLANLQALGTMVAELEASRHHEDEDR